MSPFKIKLRDCPFCGNAAETKIVGYRSGVVFMEIKCNTDCYSLSEEVTNRTFEGIIETMNKLVYRWNGGANRG